MTAAILMLTALLLVAVCAVLMDRPALRAERARARDLRRR